MRKWVAAFLSAFMLTWMFLSVKAETVIPDGMLMLENIIASYSETEAVLSDQLLVVQNEVNFRTAPGGKVLGRLQEGDLLDCLDEIQYKGDLWYFARSAEYGEGYVICTFAKPVWNNQIRPLSDPRHVVTDNMLLYAYWMGTYQIDHGLSVIETIGSDRQLNIAPLSVRGNASVLPEDMKIQLVLKLFEYGLICRNAAFDQLLNDSATFSEKNDLAVSVLRKHYGTDDIWEILSGQSIVPFIHKNDLHTRPEGPVSGRDQELAHAVLKKIVEEH